jgi:hypothetical protein
MTGRPRVVAVAVVTSRRDRAVRALGEVMAAGGSALLITADGSVAPDLPDGVQTLDLAASERAVGLHPLLTRSPVRFARRLTGGSVSGPTPAWRWWSQARPYRAVRPWVLWRALRRHLDVVAVDRVDHLVIVGIESWPIVWHLCRRNPSITYGWGVPAEVYQRAGRRPPVPA